MASPVLNQVLRLFISCVWSIHYLKIVTIKFRTLIQLPNLRWREHLNPLATKMSLSLRCREMPLSSQHSHICNFFSPELGTKASPFSPYLVRQRRGSLRLCQHEQLVQRSGSGWGNSCCQSPHNYVKHVPGVYFGLAVAWPWVLSAH